MPRPEMAAAALESLASADLRVFPYRCAVMRNRNASCTLCAQACTSGAISVDADEVTVDPELCVGCGTCATVCPTCALEARSPADAELALRARAALDALGGDTLVVVCDALWRRNADKIDPERAVRVTCLGRLDESVLVEAVARGARRVLLAHGACECCPRSAGVSTYLSVVDTANLLLETWGAQGRVELREKIPACVRAQAPAAGPAYDETRRAAFAGVARTGARMLGAEGAGDAEAAPAQGGADEVEAARPLKVMMDGTLPHFLPDRRERLLDALAELGEPADAALETRLWGRVDIDESACKGCLMCATFCPTGAIAKVVRPDGGVVLEHRPADCVKCRCCTDVCPTGALTLREDVMARELADGNVAERFSMPRVRDGRGGPHSMIGALKKIIHCDQLYER